LIHSALNTAVRWKLIKLNPATACELPRVERKEAKALDMEATEWFIDAARGHWLYPILVFAAATGCRRGEILALKWTDLALNSDTGIAHISRSLEQTRNGLRMKNTKNGKIRRLATLGTKPGLVGFIIFSAKNRAISFERWQSEIASKCTLRSVVT
jgi:integrase